MTVTRVSELAAVALDQLGDTRRAGIKTLMTPVQNVVGYGAKGDGIADDTAAIQAAIDAGPVTYFPPGRYLVTATLLVSKQQSLVGAGRELSTIIGTVLTGSALLQIKPIAPVSGVQISDLGLSLPDGSAADVIRIENAYSGRYNGLMLSGGNRAFYVVANAHSSHVAQVVINNARYGVYIQGDVAAAEWWFSDVSITRSSTTGYTEAGFTIQRTTATDVGGYYLSQVLVACAGRPSRHGFLFQGPGVSMASSPVFMVNCAADNVIDGAAFKGDHYANLFVSQSWFYAANQPAVQLGNCGDATFVACRFNGDNYGVHFLADCTKMIFTANRFPSVSYAFFVGAGVNPGVIYLGGNSIYTGFNSRLTNNVGALVNQATDLSSVTGLQVITPTGGGIPQTLSLVNELGHMKHVRVNAVNEMVILDSAFGSDILRLTDAGHLLAKGGLRPNMASAALYAGSLSPEGVVIAAVGSMYMRQDGTVGTLIYVKESGAGNTGWVAKL